MDDTNTHCSWCSAINCSNSRNKCPDMTFFTFPKDPDRCKKWVIASRREDLLNKPVEKLHKNNRMCEVHFEQCCFKATKKRKLLTKDAVPTLFTIPNPPPKKTSSRPAPKERVQFPQLEILPASTSSFSELAEVSPGISESDETKSLKRKLQTERTKNSRLRKRIKLSYERDNQTTQELSEPDAGLQFLTENLRKYLPDAACRFVCTQIRMHRLKKKARNWTHSEKSFALSLFHASNKAYSLLQKLFILPSPRTLSRAMHNINIQPGFNENIMDLFKIKVNNMSDQEKLCAIVVDEMAIKRCINYNPTSDAVEGLEDFGSLGKTGKFADHALVFMLRGLTKKWKQPIAYYLSSGPTKLHVLQHLVTESVRQVRAIGLTPKIVIWDQGSNNQAVSKILGVKSESPYFFVDDQKVFVMFDPPHLIKNIRNNLKRYGFKVGDQNVSWAYIEQFYKEDSSTPIRFATKLTKKHIMMPPFANLSVKLATQVLSHTVAAGISSMVKLRSLPEEAFATAQFVDNFDQLFNCFNSKSLCSRQPKGNAISPSSEEIPFLKKMLQWLNSIRCNNKTGELPCLEGWTLAIQCLLQLWDDLHTNHKVEFLLTNRLNQDCLENLFSVLRGKGGHRYNPDSREFKAAFRQSIVDAILVAGEGKHCQEDVDTFLFSFENIASHGAPSTLKRGICQNVPLGLQQIISSVHLPCLNIKEVNVLTNIGGYVANKLAPAVCEGCTSLLMQTIDPSNPEHRYIVEKMHSSNMEKGLKAPSNDLQNMLAVAETVFRHSISSLTVTSGIRLILVKRMVEAMNSASIVCPLGKCQLSFLALLIYTNVRLRFYIKCLNRKESGDNQKLVIRKKTSTFRHH